MGSSFRFLPSFPPSTSFSWDIREWKKYWSFVDKLLQHIQNKFLAPNEEKAKLTNCRKIHHYYYLMEEMWPTYLKSKNEKRLARYYFCKTHKIWNQSHLLNTLNILGLDATVDPNKVELHESTDFFFLYWSLDEKDN